MYKYASFVEYIQLNYIEQIRKALIDYIKSNDMDLFDEERRELHQYDDYEIRSIKVYGIHYTKNQRDKVEFEVLLKTEYRILDSIFDENSKFPPFIEKNNAFKFGMTGSFKEGFKEKDDEIEVIDDETEERLTDTLVPVIKAEEMDSYATKFLKEFCPEALETPMRLNVDKMLEDKGIKVFYAPLDDNVFGKTYFAKDKAVIYTKKGDDIFSFFDNTTEEIEVEPGTILINYDKKFELPIGAYRNTIIHEAVHWFIHSNYFELRQLLNNELTSIACYKGERNYENEEIAWMEWQARSIAPKVLMPKKMAIQKWKEIETALKEKAEEKNYTKFDILEKGLKEFKDFFGVSEVSARIRLKELGFSEVEGLNNYIDGKKIKSYFYKKSALSKNQTFLISEEELRTLLRTNVFLQNAFLEEKVFYVNKMVVVNKPDYFDYKNHELTTYALEHADECCLIFNVERFGILSTGEITKNYLLSTINSRRESKDIYIEHANRVLPSTDESFCHYQEHKKELPNTFGETLEYHYKCARKKNKVHSYEDLGYKCDVSDRAIRDYKDGIKIPPRHIVLKLCLGLKLSVPYIRDMLEKADCPITWSSAENVVLLTTLISYPRVGLEETYKILEQDGMGDILQLSEEWLRDRGL